MTPEQAHTLAMMITLGYRGAEERDEQCARLNELYPEFVWHLDEVDHVVVRRRGDRDSRR